MILVRLVCGTRGCGKVVARAERSTKGATKGQHIEVLHPVSWSSRAFQVRPEPWLAAEPRSHRWRCHGCKKTFAFTAADYDEILYLAQRAEQRGRTITRVMTPM